jgi:hypothetical protein
MPGRPSGCWGCCAAVRRSADDFTTRTWWTKTSHSALLGRWHRTPRLPWVNAQTFRPVQIDEPPFGPANTINESWLPRVPALGHAVNVPRVPAGFRQVPPAPGWN